MATLSDWNYRLDEQFNFLARTRNDSRYPVFAIEHGLASDERKELSNLLLAHLKKGSPSDSHWLLWVVYCTERGYEYGGEEYWPSFERKTPGWELQYRSGLVRWFNQFQIKYNGIIPTGPWAENYRYISWPITHALLPKYLQEQFARKLFELRFEIASIGIAMPRDYGLLLRRNDEGVSKRFREFIEQEELTGQIALALLYGHLSADAALVYAPTLDRIVSDLEAIRSAKEWLKDTRSFVVAKFKGFGRTVSEHSGNDRELQLRSHALLRQKKIQLSVARRSQDSWQFRVEIPSLRDVANLSGELRSHIASSRIILFDNSMKPTGWLLTGNRTAVLNDFPEPGKPIFRFQKPLKAFDEAMAPLCSMPALPYLFKLNGNMGTWIDSRTIRASSSYLYVNTPLGSEPPTSVKRHTRVSSLSFMEFTVPKDVNQAFLDWIRNAGCRFASTLEIQPAGLMPNAWDGEGYSEWLTTDRPCFRISSDQPLSSLSCCIDGKESFLISVLSKLTTFIELDPLNVGRHQLNVRASLATKNVGPSIEGVMNLLVSSPENTALANSRGAAYVVTVEPFLATLDELWNNEVEVSIVGPSGFNAAIALNLLRSNGTVIESYSVGLLELPLLQEDWRNRFTKFRSEIDADWSYLSTAVAELSIDIEGIGTHTVTFEHDVHPVQWRVSRKKAEVNLCLLDDTGLENKAEVEFSAFESPLVFTKRPFTEGEEKKVQGPGGLFVASKGTFVDAVIVSVVDAAMGLSGLRVSTPSIQPSADAVEPSSLIKALRLWSTGRTAGPLAKVRQTKAVRFLISSLHECYYGRAWTKAEELFLVNVTDKYGEERLATQLTGDQKFVADLRALARKNGTSKEDTEVWFYDLVFDCGLESDPSVTEFALKLAGDPSSIADANCYPSNALDFDQRRARILLLHAARFIALLNIKKNGSGIFEFLPVWKW